MTSTARVAEPLAAQALDYLNLDNLFTTDELALRDRVRAFVDERVRPNIADWYATATFPRELVKQFAALGLLGMHLKGYGCAGRSAVEYGIAAMELEAGDSGIRTFVSVQGSLAMSAIYKFGSEEQKQRWLPGMAAGDLIGCFGLTEPTAGSDPANMVTEAVRDGDGWVLNGAKRWIGLATIADVAIIWAKTADGIRGFVVPTSTPGFNATAIEPKLSMRASIQCDISLVDIRLPDDAVLPERGPLRHHVGRHGRRPRLLRNGPAVCPGASPVRAADRIVPADATKACRYGAGDPEGCARGAANRKVEGRRHAPTRTNLLRQA
jgi:glutaryl-CoA dehydrogenase